MKNAIQQFYSLLREAMFATKLTASDLSARKGVHYTYVYNSIRENANITLSTAISLAEAAGYRLAVSFEPIAAEPVLTGDMEPTGPLFSQRKRRAEKTEATPEASIPVGSLKVVINDAGIVTGVVVDAQPTKSSLDAEIDALLADTDA